MKKTLVLLLVLAMLLGLAACATEDADKTESEETTTGEATTTEESTTVETTAAPSARSLSPPLAVRAAAVLCQKAPAVSPKARND